MRLRPLRIDDEEEFLAGNRVMEAEGFSFALGYRPGMSWKDYLRSLEYVRDAVDLPEGYVPATFLVAEADGRIVGRTSIRHRLNDSLFRQGGHIGYGVLPPYRRRGYATEILRQSLVVARSLGVDHALLTCADTNIGSATVIERCGGVLHSIVQVDGPISVRRYWIS